VIYAVLDCNIVVSAVGWGGNPRRCLVLAARRKVRLCVTAEIWGEYADIVPAALADAKRSINPEPTLNWLLHTVRFVDPAPLGKQRSRDKKDDPYLGCALAAAAKYIVTNDRDLLALGKPFGIQIVTPAEFLADMQKI
jgi:putative PIN family toxin of toxin-antitoxin system